MQKRKTFKATVLTLLTASVLGGSLVGCGLFGGGIAALPFGQITAVQLFDEPGLNVVFSVEGAVSNPALISKINWVFGDGGGFVEGPAGRASIMHQYLATGAYQVTAFVFDATGFVAQVNGSVTVVGDGDGDPPPPFDVPGGISGPNPQDEAEGVSVETTLTWTGSENATSYDVYLGTSEADVEAATLGDALGISRGTQTETEYDPQGLEPDTEYFWRVDERNDNGVTTGDVQRFATAIEPEAADDFVPADGAGNVPVAQVLQWTIGDGATSHDVYFGKSQADVSDATTETDDIFQGNQTASSYDPEDDSADIDGQLMPATTYYWRVDEVGAGGTVKGAVLRFSTAGAPSEVTAPVPADGETDVDVAQNLSWSAAASIESYDVYFGNDEAAVAGAGLASPEYEGNQTSKIFDPGTLLGGSDYFWRIDSLGPGGTTHGDVSRFTTAAPPPQVAGPFVPANSGVNVDVRIVLEWNVGVGGTTTSFDVYFGTDENAVNNGLASTFQGNQDVAETSHDPFGTTDLQPDTIYFWRVDAVGPGGATTGTVLSFHTGALPDQVETPEPPDGERGVPLDVTLEWAPALRAASYGVYLGVDRTTVQNADHESAEYQGGVAVTEFVPADELEGNTEYFWRIDARSPGGSTVGEVWSFTTAPGPATIPDPLDGDTSIALDAVLGWTAGDGATTHDVFLGTDETDVENATRVTVAIYQGNQAEVSFTPADTLDGATTYYWRIDEIDAEDYVTKGIVWSFTTGAGQAAEPIAPEDGATEVELEPTLTWNAGIGAVSHDVYLGTDESVVDSATRASPEFKTNQAGTSYAVAAPLDGNTDYYWRIDEIDADDHVTKGEVWQFRTRTGQAEDPIPDNFETGVNLGAELSWTAGSGATSHDVYLGTDETAVTDATTADAEYEGNQAATVYTPVDLLDGNTTYYWRIDEVGPAGTTAGEVWEFTTAAGQAAEPIDPADGAVGIELDPTLTWIAGDGAVSHDIYFGTEEIAVDAATRSSGEFQGNQLLGDEMFTPAGPLDGNTSYYWRIDEIDADDNVTKGEVWQFHTGTGQAKDPMPEDMETGIDINTELSWTAGSGAVSHDVYLGDDETAVTNATAADAEYEGNQAGTTFVPDTLDGGTTYYWRIDEVGPGGTAQGDVWSFTTGAGQATDPDPADGSAGASLTPLLTWTPDAGAASHDVYFGTNASAVESATRTSDEFKGNQAGTTFSPGLLDGMTLYYWRIDEIDADDNATKGEIWQFRTGPGLATNPVPVDFAEDVSIETTLQWTAGIGAAQHRVYVGTSLAAVTSADPGDPEYKGSQSGTIFDPGTLPADTTHYWRIDEIAADGTTITTGDVWRFTTMPPPDQAGSPTPFNGATDIAVDVVLTWLAADGATSYDIYFSDVEADVISGAAFQGNQVSRSYNPGGLVANTTYFWRIDAVNEAGTTAGTVWSFTTEP